MPSESSQPNRQSLNRLPAPAPPQEAALKPEAKTLIEALTTGQTLLLKIRANGTKCSLPYQAVGSMSSRHPVSPVCKGWSPQDLAVCRKDLRF
jgi:hypothetical protein